MEDPFQFVKYVQKLINATKKQEQKEIRKVSVVLMTESHHHCEQVKTQLRRCSKNEEKIIILTQLWNILSPSEVVNCSNFIEYGFLFGPVTCLSSNDPHVRSIAYSVLQRFYCHMDSGEDFVHRRFWTNFIDNIRCLQETCNQQLPSIITSFFSHFIDVFGKASHPLLKFCAKTIETCKSSTDIWKSLKLLLRSSDPLSHAIQTNWSLKVIHESCSSGRREDLNELLSHGIFDLLIQLVSSSSTSTDTKILAAEIVEKCSRDELIVRKLCLDHCVYSFLLVLAIDFSNVTTTKSTAAGSKQLIDSIINIAKNIRKVFASRGKTEMGNDVEKTISLNGGQDQEMKLKTSRKRTRQEIDDSRKPRLGKDVSLLSVDPFLGHVITLLYSKKRKECDD